MVTSAASPVSTGARIEARSFCRSTLLFDGDGDAPSSCCSWGSGTLLVPFSAALPFGVLVWLLFWVGVGTRALGTLQAKKYVVLQALSCQPAFR